MDSTKKTGSLPLLLPKKYQMNIIGIFLTLPSKQEYNKHWF